MATEEQSPANQSPAVESPSLGQSAFHALNQKFHDFDVPSNFERLLAHATAEGCSNFVVEFGPDHARLAVDLDENDFPTLLKTNTPRRVETGYPIRWINIWNPRANGQAIEVLGEHFGFTKRLVRSFVTWGGSRDCGRDNAFKGSKNVPRKSPAASLGDPEMGWNGLAEKERPPTAPRALSAMQQSEQEMLRLLQESLNYTSIDHGDKFICLGAHWPHPRPNQKQTQHQASLVPPTHWNWLSLCSDYTVVSIHETPNYERTPKGEMEKDWMAKQLQAMRFNVRCTLEQVSQLGMNNFENHIALYKPVRHALMKDRRDSDAGWHTLRRESTMSSGDRMPSDGASNLFYYLFEDYSAAAPILNGSKKLINQLTSRILATVDWRNKQPTHDIIPTLHKLNKELRTLQHLFESWENLIQRILNPNGSGQEVLANAGIAKFDKEFVLPASTRNRFDRFRDRLRVLMLNTIQEYLDDMKELSNTYFNLTAQKDSDATARLTRSATLLSKLTVFFLPVSFMTSYFSVSIPDLTDKYTEKDYWVSFAIIMGLSFIGLFFFGRALMYISDILDEWVHRSQRWCGQKIGAVRRRGHAEDE